MGGSLAGDHRRRDDSPLGYANNQLGRDYSLYLLYEIPTYGPGLCIASDTSVTYSV